MAQEARECGWGSGEALLQLTLRLLLGMPADLSWRMQHVGATVQANQQLEGAMRVSTSASVKALLAATLLLGAFSAVVGVLNVFADASDNLAVQEVGQFWAGMLGFVPAALIVSGFLAQRRSVTIGTGLLVLGATAIGVLHWWTILTPALAVLVLVLGLRRASQPAAQGLE
jgi:hypothetical protein